MIRITENGQMQIQAKAQTLEITVTPPSVLNRDFVSFWLTQYIGFQELITKQG